jgi:hypothetical protein
VIPTAEVRRLWAICEASGDVELRRILTQLASAERDFRTEALATISTETLERCNRLLCLAQGRARFLATRSRQTRGVRGAGVGAVGGGRVRPASRLNEQ